MLIFLNHGVSIEDVPSVPERNHFRWKRTLRAKKTIKQIVDELVASMFSEKFTEAIETIFFLLSWYLRCDLKAYLKV